jgi:hypothetical protein
MMILATGGTAKACGGGGSGEIVQLNSYGNLFSQRKRKIKEYEFFGDHLLA